MAKRQPPALSKKQRTEILTYCLKKLAPVVRKRAALFAGTPEDLLDEVGVQIWIALLRYKHKPYNDALKLAYRTGQNRLTSLVRTMLTVKRHGHHVKMVPLEAVSPLLIQRNSNPIVVVEFYDTLVALAIRIAGYHKAGWLVRAALYDWSPQAPVTEEQAAILAAFGKKRTVNVQVHRLYQSLRYSLVSEEKGGAAKHDGVWRAELGA